MSEFEAQCDCELDSPGVLSHLSVEERLQCWTEWALYLKGRIETHYRPALAGKLTTDDVEEDVLACWDDFWRDILRPDGKLDIAQVARELYDWRVAMHEVALVYYDLTGGRFSKPNTRADYVIDAAYEFLGDTEEES